MRTYRDFARISRFSRTRDISSNISSLPDSAEETRILETEKIEVVSADNMLSSAPSEEEKSEKFKELIGLTLAGVLFGLGIFAVQGGDKASEYFAGYLLEQSLSVDNLFVFILIFKYFETTETAQNRALKYGIWGATVTRLVMILLGYEAIENFHPVLLIFAGFLVYTSYVLLTQEEEEEDVSENAVVKFCQRFVKVSENYDGDNFFTVQNGVRIATPLLLVVTIVELSDIVFAVDSVPAVFGVTTDPFIVYTSNMAAIISLRSLYYFVATVVAELEYLQTAVAVVLGFIGSKMIVEYAGVEVSTPFSLAVVAGLLGTGVAASYFFPSNES
eukprot:CAMPEP_0196582168 /NCGR_PEP_ID=MMETSP1081-20130531/37785_1 /TAXON_ID=36882 /ORGANISM="Pyramimonas amylifera, Strain CCMP720" /LENGTH=330 /DNA_ID=CAMNT_0041902657 /DNA_START=218 /DNA_END=1210 /DNA_ORIENTATION=-